MQFVLVVMQESDQPTQMVRWRTPGTELRLDLREGRVIGRLLSLDDDGLSVRSTDSHEIVSARWCDVNRISVLEHLPHPWWIVAALTTLGGVILGGGALFINGLGTIGKPNSDLPPGAGPFIARWLLTGVGSGAALGLLIALPLGGQHWLTVYSGEDWRQLEDDSDPVSLKDRIEDSDARETTPVVPLDAGQMFKWLLFGLVLFLVLKVCAP